MNYELSTYKGKPAVFDKTTRCFVLFGKKKNLKTRVEELNKK